MFCQLVLPFQCILTAFVGVHPVEMNANMIINGRMTIVKNASQLKVFFVINMIEQDMKTHIVADELVCLKVGQKLVVELLLC